MEDDERPNLPTLDEFLAHERKLLSLYIEYPGFYDLYIRKSVRVIRIDGESWICDNVVTLANVVARNPGQGAFQVLVGDLLARGYAVYVENVHNPRLAKHLAGKGFVLVDVTFGAPNFLYGHEGHLRK